MLQKEEDIRHEAVWAAAREIAAAVRTAPKTRGVDNLSIVVADADEKERVAARMDEIYERSGGRRASFARDAKGVLAASALVVIGVKSPPYGLDCGWCGFADCAGKARDVPCVFGCIDLGIGAGVAAAEFAHRHIDNRMMYSIGKAVLELGWFDPDVTLALGFPLSVTGKNPFFDR